MGSKGENAPQQVILYTAALRVSKERVSYKLFVYFMSYNKCVPLVTGLNKTPPHSINSVSVIQSTNSSSHKRIVHTVGPESTLTKDN